MKGVWKQGAKDTWEWLDDNFNLYRKYWVLEEEPEYSYEDDPEMKLYRSMPHKEFDAEFWGEPGPDNPPGYYSMTTREQWEKDEAERKKKMSKKAEKILKDSEVLGNQNKT